MSSFHHYARRAINPTQSLDRRRYALGECLRKLGTLTWQGGDFRAHRQAVRAQFNRRFGFDESVLDTERITAASLAAQVQYNQFQEARQFLWRQRVILKARGQRRASRQERQAARHYWQAALKRIEGASLP